MTETPGEDPEPKLRGKLGDHIRDDEFVETVSQEEKESVKGMTVNILIKTQNEFLENMFKFNLRHFLKTGEKIDKISVAIEGLRVAVQDFGFDMTLAHDCDVVAFRERLSEVRKWHKEERDRKRFLAPLLPVVQSSGTGKSRLLFEVRKLLVGHKEACRSILLTGQAAKSKDNKEIKERKNYDEVYCCDKSESEQSSKNSLRTFILKQCQEASKGNAKDEENTPIHVFLFFDEAQHLTVNQGFLFRVLRWIVRERSFQSTTHGGPYQITAVLAGTNSSLANFFPEEEIESNNSRVLQNDSGAYFLEGNEPYPPFFMLRTQGCLSQVSPLTITTDNDSSEYQKMIRFSRPLFKILHDNDKLSSNAEYDIATKIVLGETTSWITKTKSSLSVLATRIQMGATSTSVVSELVSKGYAHLTFFRSKDGDKMDISSLASFAFLPDPVCARIAMCLMDEQFESVARLNESAKVHGAIKGAPKTKLVKMMGRIFSTGLCFPAKGDLGEIAVALYLLFCGDILRKEENGDDKSFWYHKLSVDFSSWMQHVWNLESSAAPSPTFGNLMINCIQFFRYPLKSSLKELGDAAFLKSLYEKACSIYCSANTEAIDAVVPCYDPNGNVHIPVFVSIKNYAALYPKAATMFLQGSYETLCREGISTGILLLVIAGQDRNEVSLSAYEDAWNKTYSKDILISASQSEQPDFRKKLCVGYVCVHDDQFEIHKMLRDSSFTKDQQTAEVYSMHSELIHREQVEGNVELPGRYSKGAREFFEETCGVVAKK